ncbi:chemotaxis-specific protein-glutamate methyltransferase CheB [Candidatus Poribacteria bacterium]|nr:chemotaxis-specific protein-glutamate methyltransferase CheB [Candidatus Poribacteria bacterium]
MEPIRVLVVDDSAFMRRAIQKMLESDQNIKVVGRARNGKEALAEIRRLKPDVVTLNLVMPEMDGLTALKIIMAEMPLPVIIVSASAEEGDKITMDALSIGAVDFVTKPTAEISFDVYSIRQILIEKVIKASVKAHSYKRAEKPSSAKTISLLSETDIVKVLVVDDLDVMRTYISELLEFDPTIKVVGTACDGQDAIQKLETLKPDVITLDLNMPRLDGFAALEYIMKQNPIPVVIISSYTTDASCSETIRALELGAVDFIPKLAVNGETVKHFHKELIGKVKTAASVDISKLKRMRPTPISTSSSFLYDGTFSFPLNKGGQGVVRKRKNLEGKIEVVAIGASTGGPQALEIIITALPTHFPASVLVAQHMPAMFTLSFAQRLNEKSQLTVREAKMKDRVEAGVVLIAPGDYHIEVIKSDWEAVASIVLNEDKSTQTVKPSVDLLLKSVANVFGARAMGILLTGMGRDGAEGMKAIKNAGGITIAQDENSSLIFGMPKAAIETGCVDETLPLEKIAQKIIEIV